MRKRYKFFEIRKHKFYLVKKKFFKNIYIKYLIKNVKLPFFYRQSAILFLFKNNDFIRFTSLRFVCLETGKSRSILINFKVSRLILKRFVSSSVMSGVYKYS